MIETADELADCIKSLAVAHKAIRCAENRLFKLIEERQELRATLADAGEEWVPADFIGRITKK